MITLTKLKTEHLASMTRAELEERIVQLEARLEGCAIDLERIAEERDALENAFRAVRNGAG
jgi:uncharacterized small protein (DUF1192 family)